MLFLRITVLILLLAKPLYYSSRNSAILDCDELIKLGDENGLKAVEDLICPLKLLYLDTTYARHIVDWEFNQGFLKGYPDSCEYYMLDLPVYTLDIASNTNNRYAVSKLFLYYCSVPKVKKSDTVFRIYDQLYKFLPIFVYRKPYQRLLERKLRKDFQEWSRIVIETPPRRYADPSVEFDRFLNLKPMNNRPDSRHIVLMIGLSLQQLKSPSFTEERIKNLRNIQSSLANKRFQLPVFSQEQQPYTEPLEKLIFPTSGQYQNINQLVSDIPEMNRLVSAWLAKRHPGQDLHYSQSKYLVKRPDKAYFEIYYDYGMQALKLTLQGKQSIMIEKLMEAID